MKIKGRKIAPNEELIVIPRGNDETIVLKARAVLDFSDFDRLCPRPIVPIIQKRGGGNILDTEDKDYQKAINEYGAKRYGYMIIKSLEATDELEWERLNANDPSTWNLYEEEFRESGFSEFEIRKILDGVSSANGLNDARMEEAKKNFLLSQEANHDLS